MDVATKRLINRLAQGLADMVDRDICKKYGYIYPKTNNQKFLEQTNFLNYNV